MSYKVKMLNNYWYFCTCWEVFINWPVIHLQRSIATISGKADNMILSIIYWGTTLFHTDVHCANVERHSNLALLLERENIINYYNALQSWYCPAWQPCRNV